MSTPFYFGFSHLTLTRANNAKKQYDGLCPNRGELGRDNGGYNLSTPTLGGKKPGLCASCIRHNRISLLFFFFGGKESLTPLCLLKIKDSLCPAQNFAEN